MPYDCSQLTVVVPTKDRPRQITELLQSLANGSVQPGKIVIVDGGESVRDVAMQFSDRLRVEHLTCHPPGQIRQRLMGLEHATTDLVGFFDDDIVFENDALEEMISFWNMSPVDTAGVAFNITNAPSGRRSLLGSIFGMSGPPGKVLPSGFNVSVANVDHDFRADWLPGGCTVWRRSVVDEFPQENIKTKWAVGEDVRFSYPIGRKYPLFVCSRARVVDTGQSTPPPAPERLRFQGRKAALALYYLSEKHPELSSLRCVWMIFGSAILIGAKSVLQRTPAVHRAIGQLHALGNIANATLTRRSIKSALED